MLETKQLPQANRNLLQGDGKADGGKMNLSWPGLLITFSSVPTQINMHHLLLGTATTLSNLIDPIQTRIEPRQVPG